MEVVVGAAVDGCSPASDHARIEEPGGGNAGWRGRG